MSRYQLFDPIQGKTLDALRQDIKEHGVLVPIEVDEHGEILDGHHRAAIAEELGVYCPRLVRHFKTEEEKQEHIYKINLLRRHLDSAAWGKAFRSLLEIRGARRGQGTRNDANYSQTSATVAEVAREIGVPERTARQRLAHVETAEEYPFMQREEWKQYHVLEARESLESLPDEERPRAAAILDQPAFPPTDGIKALKHIASMPEPERQDIYSLYESDDRRDRSLAVTRAVALPPEPDPRRLALLDFMRRLKGCLKEFKGDPFNAEIEALVVTISDLDRRMKEAEKR